MRYHNVIVYFELWRPEAKFPTRKHEGDAGMDFYAYGDYIIKKNSWSTIKTGISVKLPDNYNGLLKSKSISLLIVGAGVIENNYQGEILFKVFNTLDIDVIIRNGDAVGQMILIPAYSPVPKLGTDIHKEKTNRGTDGGIVRENENNYRR